MTKYFNISNKPLTLSIVPTTKGVAYAVFEEKTKLVDYAHSFFEASKATDAVSFFQELLDFYEPQYVVLDDYNDKETRRAPRIKTLIRLFEQRAKFKDCQIFFYTQNQQKEAFSSTGVLTKYQRARVICNWFEQLYIQMPYKRKPWQSTDYRQGVFDAISLALTHFYLDG